MRTLVVTELISLDGVVDSPAPGSEFPHAGWTFDAVEFDEAAYEIKGREQVEAAAMLVGRKSWEEFHPVWPSMTQEFPGYNAMPKYVVSSSLTEEDLAASEWQPMTLLRDIDAVAELRAGEGGPIIVHGSSQLAQALAAAGLVDRYHLLVFPVLLGSNGHRLFDPAGPRTPLRLVEQETYGNGVQKQVLEVDR